MKPFARSSALTPAAQRTVARCRQMAMAFPETDSWVAHLVLTLLLDESLASVCLAKLGITRDWLIAGPLGDEVARTAAKNPSPDDTVYAGEACGPSKSLDALNDPVSFTRVLDRATEISRRSFGDGGVSSVHLLLAILETSDVVRDALADPGATVQRIQDELQPASKIDETPLPIDEPLTFSDDETPLRLSAVDDHGQAHSPSHSMLHGASAVWRVLDANLNRSREGLRVLEDFARFIADDDAACLELKSMRHELVQAEKVLAEIARRCGAGELLGHRDTSGDVGTTVTTSNERSRSSLLDLIVANCRRVQESLRSLEEFGKLPSPEFAAIAKQLRYRTYIMEQRLIPRAEAESSGQQAHSNHQRLQSAHVYVLITESMCLLPWKQVVEECLAAGADVLQLREKHLNDREILQRARWIRDACHSANALFIVNDRADLAAACDADGVHVGQEELSVAECRQLLQPWQLVGVSTHNVSQIEAAMNDGADYIGVGPVFPSKTKPFEEFPGLDFVKQAAAASRRPWFAIGGITTDNVLSLVKHGCRRVAVTSAVIGSQQPGDVVGELRQRLKS